MVMNLSLRLFCENLKATKPPYNCPVENCGKRYMSYAGIRYHLYNYDHEQTVESQLSPSAHDPSSPAASEGKGVRNRWLYNSQADGSPMLPECLQSYAKDALSPTESKQLIEFYINGRLYKINRCEPLDVTDKRSQSVPHSQLLHVDRNVSKDGNDALALKMPVADFRILEEYVRPTKRPASQQVDYYRYVEKTAEELNEEVEYDMDEEDYAWLELMNEVRKEKSFPEVSNATFELVMDRFEKEAFFLSQSPSKKDRLSSSSVDEDAVCVICLDGECQNSNVILFCDMCNLAVHQECYGVPYIPEGQWLCRRCLQSPSRAVDCCLCPNKGGAFKQTSDGRWAHVVCALWIPEVCFANPVFLEPIDSIENIPSARWRLMCYICRQRQTGASIQCHRPSCYTAFHVTCAQQAGLYMKIIPVTETNANGISITNVCKTAFCDVHFPLNISPNQPMINHSFSSDDMNGEDSRFATTPAEAKALSREKMKQARKILAEKRRSAPAISIPVLSNDTLMQIAGRVNLRNKEDFLSRLKAYWTLKRQSRNGVPLLRRLQTNHLTKNKDQLILCSTESGERSEQNHLKSGDNRGKYSLDSENLYDTGLSDENTGNSDSKGFALELDESKFDTNLKELMELKMEVKPQVTLSSEVGSEAAMAISPNDNCISVRRSPRVLSGGEGSPFQQTKVRHVISEEEVKVEEDSSKELDCEKDTVLDEKQNNDKNVISLKIKIPKCLRWNRARAGDPNCVDKNSETVLKKEERKLRKKRKSDDFASVEDKELMVDVESTGLVKIQQEEEQANNKLNIVECGKSLRKKRKKMAETGVGTSVLESFEKSRVSQKRSSEKREPKKRKVHWDSSDFAVKKKRKNRNVGVNIKSLATSASVIEAQENEEKEGMKEPEMGSYEELKQLQRLRQSLERVRLLVELIQKRERMKMLELQLFEKIVKLRLKPFAQLLHQTLDRLQQKDTRHFFAEPVSLEEVPDYLDHIHCPMDFSTMRLKVEAHQYRTVENFKSDFDLIISNCMTYNAKGTIYYSAAVRLCDQGQSIIQDTQKAEATVGYDPDTGLHLLDRPSQTDLTTSENQNSEFFFPGTWNNLPLEKQLNLLLDELEAVETTSFNRHSGILYYLKKEIARVRKQLVAPQTNAFASCMEHEAASSPVLTGHMIDQMNTVNLSPRLTRSASGRKTDMRHDTWESFAPSYKSTPSQAVTQEMNMGEGNKESTEKPDDSCKRKRQDLCQSNLKTDPACDSIQVTCAAAKFGRNEICNIQENSFIAELDTTNETTDHKLISPINLLSSSSVIESDMVSKYSESKSMNSVERHYDQPTSLVQQSILPVKEQLPIVGLSQFEQPLLQPWTPSVLMEPSALVDPASIEPVFAEPPPTGPLPLVEPTLAESESSFIYATLSEQHVVPQIVQRRRRGAGGLLELPQNIQTTSIIMSEPGYVMHFSEETVPNQCGEQYQRKHLEEKQPLGETVEDSLEYQESIESERKSAEEIADPGVSKLDPSKSVCTVEKSAHYKRIPSDVVEDCLGESARCLMNASASESVSATIQCNTENWTNDELSAVSSPVLESATSGPSLTDHESLD